MKQFNPILCVSIVCTFILLNSCKKVVVEFDCGEVTTEITELEQRVGSYIDSSFTNNSSSNFAEAAIAIYAENLTITSETETSCFAFTALPQLIENISITSSSSVTSGGVAFASGENLIGLFKFHSMEQTYSSSEFISAQNAEPLIFHNEDDKFVLQLLNQPDVDINQSFEIELTFDDSKKLSVEVPIFEVTN